jgi:hypothetical protein
MIPFPHRRRVVPPPEPPLAALAGGQQAGGALDGADPVVFGESYRIVRESTPHEWAARHCWACGAKWHAPSRETPCWACEETAC